ncbi:BspA family leucine-rich repeat surface protein [Mycoplasma feriruminatoris]|uniref:BspA family leucine-rich repeat surface protein n=1 Tax=Mycoplasma feriruminatoris TaxID=1179777 RepID=UPI00241D5105|nr:BspA family leucine-rich repeat surface protein [Mycoplasma feriruminatoris]WFQ95785.1 BspA family leucine-rich repeat surface protein [Mycoplasma feriruminatoris]
MKMLLKALSFILVSSSSLLVISCTNNKPSSSQNINSNRMNANTRNNNDNNHNQPNMINDQREKNKRDLTTEEKQTVNDIFASQQDAFATFHNYQDVVDQLQVFLAEKNLKEIVLANPEENNKSLELDESGNKNTVKVRVFGNEFEFKPKTVKDFVETKYSDDNKKEKAIQLGYKKKTEGQVDYYVLNTLDKETKEVPIHLPLKVNSLSGAFKENTNEQILNLDKWDIKNVVSLKDMFYEAKNFNQDLSDWDVSNVKNMSNMFSGAEKFNNPLNKWNVSKVTDMESMFDGAMSFNQDLNNWKTDSLINLSFTFRSASKFNKSLKDWNVFSVRTMEGMFSDAISFNQDISLWRTDNVGTMNGMFSGAKAFNQTLSKWNVSKVKNTQNFAKDIETNLTKDKLPNFIHPYSDEKRLYGK